MFCHKCGNQLPEGALFCQKCGAQIVNRGSKDQSLDIRTVTNEPEKKSTGKQSQQIYANGDAKHYHSDTLGAGNKVTNRTDIEILNKGIMQSCIEFLIAIGFSAVPLVAIYATLAALLGFNINRTMVVIGLSLAVIGVVLKGIKRLLEKSKVITYTVLGIIAFLFIIIVGGSIKSSQEKQLVLDGTSQNHSNSASSSNRIMINETQSYDNEFGNIQVTLKYVEFVDKVENTLTGDYLYPDKDNVFLWAAITVENIGTVEGSLITAWNTLIYDNTYEFTNYYTVGDSLKNISPLTSPTDGAIIFMVPSAVAESDGTLVLNINDAAGEPIISYTIRNGNNLAVNDIKSNLAKTLETEDFSTTNNTNTEAVKDNRESTNGLMDYKMAYAQKVRELAADDTIQFSLIYLTGNKIPELVAEHHGYDVSVFAWADGEIVTLMDQWAYGAGGNIGYEYLPGNNIIRNYNMDYAGAVIYELYFTVNDSHEVIELLDEELSIWYFRDINEDGEIDEDEYCDDPIFYYGDTEVSEEEYDSYQVKGDFETIRGELSSEEILAQLDEDKSNKYDNFGAIESNLSNGFMWIEEPTGRTDEVMTEITGVIQNTSDYAYDYASISFNLYDSFGNQIGTAMASITDFKSGGTWRFEAIGEGNAPRFEFSSFDYN